MPYADPPDDACGAIRMRAVRLDASPRSANVFVATDSAGLVAASTGSMEPLPFTLGHGRAVIVPGC